MSTEATQRLQPGDGTNESTGRGCTPWLLISIIVLTSTTAFVFGWGLGAPNMYNHYTEPFLKGNDPCLVERLARENRSQTTAAPIILDNQNVDRPINTGDGEVSRDENGNVIAEARPRPSITKEPFNFLVETIKGIPQTVFLICAFIGAITGPFWVNLFDRKRTVFANYIFCFASSLCVLLASYLNQPWLFYLSRLLLGYQGGMACVVVPPFIGEIASQKVRGSAGAAFQLGLTLGILAAQVIGLPFFAGKCDSWGWGLAIVFLFPLVGIFLLFLIPNSPTQMIAKYNDEEQATTDLRKLRGTNDVQADLDAIHEQTRQASGSKTEALSILQVLTSARYRWPMLTTVALQFGQALSGVNAVFFYSSKMFAKAGIPLAYIPYANIGTGIINVLATIVSLYLIERLGRKALIVYPMCGMVVIFGILTALVQLNETRNSPALGLASVVFILLFVICFAVGLGPIPYLYSSEVCRPEARDGVQSLGLVANYIGNILLSLFFPALNSVLGGYVFLIFSVVVLLHVIFLFKFMPETKNTTIEEVEKHWNITPQTGNEKLISVAPVTT
jgi:SP family facilitated glucose transporter-like MFS transporter 1